MSLSTQTLLPPWLKEPEKWLTTSEFAIRWNRSESTIRRWIMDGTLKDAGVVLWKSSTRKWWLKPQA